VSPCSQTAIRGLTGTVAFISVEKIAKVQVSDFFSDAIGMRHAFGELARRAFPTIRDGAAPDKEGNSAFQAELKQVRALSDACVT
jgi:hypothetical protein